MDKLIAAAKLFGTEGAKKLAGDMVSFLEKRLPRAYTDVTSKKKRLIQKSLIQGTRQRRLVLFLCHFGKQEV